ncbi:hypothetical protein [Nocardia cyriacigeorgica]|uniref:hypothetical protein n=1 Tax=Nocardia cyriacigeorgica TaxID=135487 RepID=UPI0024572F65|nr:hypothetical protein [Nocardia cyriacigeorgica]
MPELVAAFAVAGAVGVLIIGIIYVLPWMVDREDQRHEPPEKLPAMSVQRARDVMQLYRRRTLESSPEKRAAYRTLVQAGVIVPDPRAERFLR